MQILVLVPFIFITKFGELQVENRQCSDWHRMRIRRHYQISFAMLKPEPASVSASVCTSAAFVDDRELQVEDADMPVDMDMELQNCWILDSLDSEDFTVDF